MKAATTNNANIVKSFLIDFKLLVVFSLFLSKDRKKYQSKSQMLKELINDLNTFSVTATDCIDFNKFHLYILLSGKTFAKKKN